MSKVNSSMVDRVSVKYLYEKCGNASSGYVPTYITTVVFIGQQLKTYRKYILYYVTYRGDYMVTVDTF